MMIAYVWPGQRLWLTYQPWWKMQPTLLLNFLLQCSFRRLLLLFHRTQLKSNYNFGGGVGGIGGVEYKG